MNKRDCLIAVTFVFLILFVSFVNADDSNTLNKETDKNKEELKAGVNNLQDKTNNLLGQNVSFSPFVKELAKFVFGVSKDESLSANGIIVLICLWIMFVLIVRQILALTTFFEGNGLQWTGAIVISLLSALSGGFIQIYYFFFGIAELIEPLKKWRFLQLIVSILILLIFFFGTSKILKILKNKMGIAKAEEKGRKISQGAKSAEVFNKGIEDLAK